MHVDDELLSDDDQLARDMVRKLNQKFLVKQRGPSGQGFRSSVGTWNEQTWGTDSSPRIDTLAQVLKNINMENFNLVSTPGLQMTDKDLPIEEQLIELLAGLYARGNGSTSLSPLFLCCRTAARCSTGCE